MKYSYAILTDTPNPVMLLDTHIGMDEEDGMGIDGAIFSRELTELANSGKESIGIWVNSIGGTVLDAYSIISAMQKAPIPVNTYNLGIAASSALNIFLNGAKRFAMDYSIVMMHNVSGADGDVAENINASIAGLISGHSGKTIEEVRTLMSKETYMRAEEAKASGLVDEVENSGREISAAVPTNGKAIQAKFSTRVKQAVNKISVTTKPNISNMKRVANKLGLVEGASEDVILEAVNKMEARANTAEGKVESLESTLATAKTDLSTAQDKVSTLTAEKTAAAKAANKEKATAVVLEGVKAGKIAGGESEEAKAIQNKWIGLAEADLEGTTELIDSLGVNKVAPNLELDNKKEAGYTMAGELAKINARIAKEQAH